MALNAAGFIDGGRVYGETLRRALYASTNGATGVTRSNDFAVVAFSTPGAGVWVSRGGGVIATSFSDADPGQSYSVSNNAAFSLAVPTNGTASPVTWQVIVRVSDPQYAGEPIPPDPAEDTYSVIELVQTLPATKPYLHLATIVMPGNTSVVQQSYITNRRKLAQPRSERLLRTRALAAGVNDPADVTAGFAMFPDEVGWWDVEVPSWATAANVIGTWGQVAYYLAGDNRTELCVQVASDYTPNDVLTESSWSVIANSAGPFRLTVSASDTIPVHPSWRGNTIRVRLMAKKVNGTVNLTADEWSSLILDIQWVEGPTSES